MSDEVGVFRVDEAETSCSAAARKRPVAAGCQARKACELQSALRL